MDLLNGSFDDALTIIAERRLCAMLKQSADPATAQDARQSLGILGVPSQAIDSALASPSRGVLGFGSTASRIRSAVPGALEQFRNVPKAIGVSLQQGRPGDAMAQADVIGAKNLADPTTLAASAGMGGGAFMGMQTYLDNQHQKNVLHGNVGAPPAAGKGGKPGKPTDPLSGLLGGKSERSLLEKWRRSQAKKPTGMKAVAEDIGRQQKPWMKPVTGAQSAFKNLREHLAGPAETTHLGVLTKTIGGPKAPQRIGRPVNLDRNTIRAAAKKPSAAAARPAFGKALGYGVPVAAAALPLLYREWMSGSGYRSGNKPIQDLTSGG